MRKCLMILRDISLTIGAGGLMNRWGDHSFLVPYFGRDHSIPDPIYCGSKNHKKNNHKIDVMEDH